MAKRYSQDLRDRVIDAVERGEMSRREAGRHYKVSQSVAIKWLERLERHGSREPVGHGGHRASELMPHRQFLEAARAEKSDLTLQALERLSPVAWLASARESAKGVRLDALRDRRINAHALVDDVNALAPAKAPGRLCIALPSQAFQPC